MAGVDRELLHRYLWSKSGRNGILKLDQQALADHLYVNKWTMSRITHEFLEMGAMRLLAKGYGNVRTYVVKDPDLVWQKEDEHV